MSRSSSLPPPCNDCVAVHVGFVSFVLARACTPVLLHPFGHALELPSCATFLSFRFVPAPGAASRPRTSGPHVSRGSSTHVQAPGRVFLRFRRGLEAATGDALRLTSTSPSRLTPSPPSVPSPDSTIPDEDPPRSSFLSSSVDGTDGVRPDPTLQRDFVAERYGRVWGGERRPPRPQPVQMGRIMTITVQYRTDADVEGEGVRNRRSKGKSRREKGPFRGPNGRFERNETKGDGGRPGAYAKPACFDFS